MINSSHIKDNFPQCWSALNDYYNKHFQVENLMNIEEALKLPFAFTVGIWIVFFRENGFDLDVQSLDMSIIEGSVLECLQSLEHSMSHFS